MIEKKIVNQKIREFMVQEEVHSNVRQAGHSHTNLQMTPLGEKIIVHASRPGMVVGKGGQTIKKLTATLKKKFKFENPQIEINEVEEVNLDPQIVAERIANSLERFGSARFKGIGHKTMEDVMRAGALGIEVVISGKVPSTRAKTWRFSQGYLKKSGDVVVTGVRKAYTEAKLKTGILGIQVRIMPPDLRLPDDIKVREERITIKEVVVEKPKKKTRKKAKKRAKKQEAKPAEAAVENES